MNPPYTVIIRINAVAYIKFLALKMRQAFFSNNYGRPFSQGNPS